MDCFLLFHVEPFNFHPKKREVLISQQWLSYLPKFMAKSKPKLQRDEFLKMLADLET